MMVFWPKARDLTANFQRACDKHDATRSYECIQAPEEAPVNRDVRRTSKAVLWKIAFCGHITLALKYGFYLQPIPQLKMQ